MSRFKRNLWALVRLKNADLKYEYGPADFCRLAHIVLLMPAWFLAVKTLFIQVLLSQAALLSTRSVPPLPSKSMAPTLDNLHNFLLTTTTEVLSFFQQLREAP